MIRYADPEVCPCCRESLPYAATRCDHCHTVLTGTTAEGLFRTLALADRLVAQLTASTPVREPVVVGPGGPAHPPLLSPLDPVQPVYPAATWAPSPRRGMSAASVPKILLGLGATCLLAAAVVFLVVAWSDLAMGTRTAILLTLTAAAAVTTGWMARRALPAGAESFGVLFLGFLTLDVFGADNAGWLGDLSGQGFTVLLGSVLLVAGLGTAYAAARAAVPALVGGQLVGVAGAVLVAAGCYALADYSTVMLVAAAVGTGALAVAAGKLRLAVAAWCAGGVTFVWWFALVVDGTDRIGPAPTLTGVWSDVHAWPMLVAAALAVATAALPRVPQDLRLVGPATGVTIAAYVAVAPALDEPETTLALVGLAVVAVGSAVALLARGAWRWVCVVPTGLAVVLLAALAAMRGAAALGTLLGQGVWQLRADERLQVFDDLGGAWAVLLPACVLGAALAVLVFLRVAEVPLRPGPDVAGTLTVLAAAVAPGLYAVPLWSALVPQGLAIVVLLAAARVRGQVPLAGAALLGAVALGTALANDWLGAAALLVLVVVALTASLRGPRPARIAGDVLLAPAAAGLTWSVLHLADGPVAVWWAVPVVVLAGLAAVTRPVLERELSAALTACVAVAVALADPSGLDQTWLAVYLTLAGVLVMVSALVHPSRRHLGWLGLTLLTLAQWVRLQEIGVDQVEAYTLPLALVLLGLGLVQMRRRDVSSRAALAAGLSLALGPSLLVALTDPVSLRALLLGLACLALVAAGVGLRWSAPLVAGATVGLVLVLREAAYAQVVPQWVVIGLVGTVLTVVGVTWERRLAELRAAAGYVRRLR
jgi:hypothetical protein